MTWQRRRGEPIRLFREKKVVDQRGNEQLVADPDGVWDTRCAAVFDESAKAEMPGQMTLLQLRVLVPWRPEAGDVSIWSVASFRGDWWDVRRHPAMRVGRGPVRHVSLWLRRRPGPGGAEGEVFEELPNG